MSGSMSREEVLELVRSQLAEIMEIEPAVISEDALFIEDLKADSLALIELVEALEDSLKDTLPGFRIEDDELERMLRISDAVDYIAARAAVD